MKLEDQVLSIEQVQELQELGFDIEKYASMCWLPPANEVNSFSPVNKQFWNAAVLKHIPTLTIGDIIEVLPEKIPKYYSLEIGKHYVDYCDNHVSINGVVEEKLINALFEMLKWCIKEKHIEL